MDSFRRGAAASRTGVYASLNGGVGSRDEPDAVAENRARMAGALGVDADRLLVPYQVHSPDAVAVSAPRRARCDCAVTGSSPPRLASASALPAPIAASSCSLRPRAGVIGAAHAGWRGALTGIVEATVAAMGRLGARPQDIVAALGPTIAQASYEVGPEFVATFAEAEPDSGRFFVPSINAGRSMFDLHGFIGMRIERCGIERFEDLGLDTYSDEERFFSYRRTTHRKEADYGRLVAAIALLP